MIPQFPKFKAVEVSDRATVEAHTHRYPPYSDFNFTSLWAWDTSGERMISELNANLVVRFTDYSTHEPFFSFLGANEQDNTARTLLEHATETGIIAELRLMPQCSVADIRSSALHSIEDRNNFDYVYSVPEHSALSGGHYKRSRNFVNRFERDNPDARVEIVDLANKHSRKSITGILRSWEQNKIEGQKEYELEHEEASITRLSETSGSHELIVTAVYIRDEMVAFSIDELLPDHYGIAHFWKANGNFHGVYDFLLRAKARHLEALGVTHLNFEQDLGVEGLRRSKTSLNPTRFLKKYRVALQGDLATGHPRTA